AVVMPSRWVAWSVSWSCLTAEPGMSLTTAGGGSSWALAAAQPVRNRAAAAREVREAGLLVRMTDSLRVLRGGVSPVRHQWPAGGSCPPVRGARDQAARAGQPTAPDGVLAGPATGLAAPAPAVPAPAGRRW